MSITTTKHFFVSFLLMSLISHGLSICDDFKEVAADVCYKLYDQIDITLLEDKGNFYNLRRAFFYSPNANPVLLRVIYNVSFAENVTELARQEPNYCIRTSGMEENDTITLNDTQLVLGWTSSGVFTVFHPLTINFMQIQLPFVLMRIMFGIFSRLDPTNSGPEASTFLWDESYELPTLRINLHFSLLPCIPSDELFNSALMDFNSLIRIYAGRAVTGVVRDSGNTRLVGFSLPSYSVSSHQIRVGLDIWFYFGYVLSSVILYITCIATLYFVVSKTNKQYHLKKYFTEEYTEILYGVTTVISVFIVAEILSEVIMAIIWTANINDSVVSFIVFLSAFIYISPAIVSICKVIYDNRKCDRGRKDTIFEVFVCAVAYFVYIMLYSSFPAFILAFAYPTRLITIFAFVFAFTALSTVCIITYIKFIQELEVRFKGKKRASNVSKLCYSTCLTVVLLSFFLFVFALLYSLIVGRASVASSAPLAVLSLLPSILISLAAWVMKSTLLTHANSEKEEKGKQSKTGGNQSTEEKSGDTELKVNLRSADIEEDVTKPTESKT